jgi:hypothetical protein
MWALLHMIGKSFYINAGRSALERHFDLTIGGLHWSEIGKTAREV